MKNPPAPAAVVELSAAQLRRLDARLRARELRLRAEGQQPLRKLLDANNPQLRLVDPYKF